MADRRIQVFYTVAKQLSFTKAAEQLFMTQPAVTFQVKQLEEQFNVRLFDRAHGRIALTAAGELVMGYAERLISLTQEMETRVSELTGKISGPLLIGASTTIAEYMLPPLLGEFKRLHPETQARLVVANTETIEQKVADHTLDMGLIEAPSHNTNLVIKGFCSDELVMICTPDHPLAKRESVSPEEVIRQPYINRETGSGTRECIDSVFKESQVDLDELNLVMELGSREAIKGAVIAGLGVAVVSATAVAKEVRLGELVMVPLNPPLLRQMSLVYPPEKFRSKLLQTFLDFIEASQMARPSCKAGT